MHCLNMGKAIAVGVISVLMASTGWGVERAAGIEYEFVGRPAGLRADYGAPAASGVEIRFLAMKSIDGNPVDAALQQPIGKTPQETTLVVAVHGSGDGFDVDPNAFLAGLLAKKGYGVLGINTRQAHAKVNTDNFMEIRRDIEAAVYTGRALGYRKFVLLGHSLGNIQVQYYAANNWDLDIKGVVLLSMFGNLPWKSRNLLVQNQENWSQLQSAAMKSLRQGTLGDVLPVRMLWITGQEVAMTGQHFLSYRAEESSTADGTYWVKRVPYPILMVRDQADAIIQSFEPYQLLSAATATGSLVPSIEYVLLPNKKPPSLMAHRFVDNQQALADTVVKWLADMGL